MPSVMTIEGARSRRLKRSKRGLGSSATDHQKATDSYRAVFNDSMKRVDDLLSRNQCRPAFGYLIDMAQMAQGYKSHAMSFNRSKESRSKVGGHMNRAITARINEFQDRCLR